MLSTLTATEVAFLLAGVMQAVAAGAWAIGAWVVADERPALSHWATYAGFSGASFPLLAGAMLSAAPATEGVLRAAGNLSGIVAMLALQRGIRHFTRRPLGDRTHLALLGVVLATALIGLDPAAGPVRVGVNSGVLAWLSLSMARDLTLHARDSLRLRMPWLLALPLLLGMVAFGARGLRALLAPESVQAEMVTHSALNVGSTIGFVVLTLALHATLMALVTGRLVVELRRLSRHDGLTGLLNRRAIEEALDAQMQRSRRSGEVFALMMLDIDHFKAINDHYGHAVGDLALKHAALLLHGGLREVDRLGRYGGEEFLLLLPGLPLAQAQPVAERLRENLAARPLLHGGETIAVSVSIGIAEWNGDTAELPRVLAHADAALYRAKAAGRNRVVAQAAVQVAWSG